MDYRVLEQVKLPCRIIDVQLKSNSLDGAKFVLVKLGDYLDGKFIRTVILSGEDRYEYFLNDMYHKKRHTINKLKIKLSSKAYRKLTWDDVYKGICTRDHLFEVERDSKGKPVIYEETTVYANTDGGYNPTIFDILSREYVEVNSPLAQSLLTFNNRESFLMRIRNRRNGCFSESDDLFEPNSNSYYDRVDYSDMTEEDRVMDALENGQGELYGF